MWGKIIVDGSGCFEVLGYRMMGFESTGDLKLIETAGRTAYQSHDKQTDESAKDFVRMLRKLGHESVLEHSCMSVRFSNVSRGFTHEMVRHRLASFTQESTRYVDESGFDFVVPSEKFAGTTVELYVGNAYRLVTVEELVGMVRQMYKGLREQGWAAEDARQILPIGMTSEIVVTANFREWRHIFKLRTSPKAHWEIQGLMRRLLLEVASQIPVVFDDLVEGL